MSGDTRRPPWLRLLQALVSVAVVGVIFLFFLPRIVDYREVWAAMNRMTWLEFATLGVLAVWNQMTYSLLEASARPGLDLWQATQITQTSTAISNTLPAGAALGVGVQSAMYSSFGFHQADIALSLMVTGLWNSFIKLAMPIAALVLLAFAGRANGGLISASAIGLAILVVALALFGMALRSERGALRAGRVVGAVTNALLKLFRRPPVQDWGALASDFRRRTIDLLRARWLVVTAAALASHITLYLILLLTLRHVGISNAEVSWQETLAAFAFVRLISVIPVTPGGLGVVELGLTAALVAAGGNEGQVVASVLIFRVLTFVLPIPFGGATYLFWRRGASQRARARAALT
jgi:putative heme transporter